jgi:uncharacterized integral membrane protein
MTAILFVYIVQNTTTTEVALFFSKRYAFTLFQEPKLGAISVADISAMLLLLIVENIKLMTFW